MATALQKRPVSAPPEDDIREGSEDDMPTGRKGRKPRARKGGCSCHGEPKRSDALSPQEYLDACDLGIEDRSRSYIRARLDSAARLDLKCGNGSISKGEKCTKGATSAARKQNGPSIRKGARKGASIGARAGALVGAGHGAVLGAAAGPAGVAAGALGGAAIGALGGAIDGAVLGGGINAVRKYGRNRERNREVQAGIAKLNPKFKKQYEAAKASGASRKELMQLSIKQAGEIDKLMNKKSNKRRDSVYAVGFSPDTYALGI